MKGFGVELTPYYQKDFWDSVLIICYIYIVIKSGIKVDKFYKIKFAVIT